MDAGIRPGGRSSDAERIAQLERENRELRRAILKAISVFFAARPWAGSLSGDARSVPTDSGSGTPSVTRGYLRRGRRGRRRSTFARPYICRSIISEAGLIHRVLQQTSDHLVDRLPGRPGSGDGVLNGPARCGSSITVTGVLLNTRLNSYTHHLTRPSSIRTAAASTSPRRSLPRVPGWG